MLSLSRSCFRIFFLADITSTAKIAEVAEEIRTHVGHPTIIVNNAGVARGATILDGTENDVRFTFDVNILAHFWILKEFLPHIAKNNHGHVVTVASVAGYQTSPQLVDYGATKAAAISLHEGMHKPILDPDIYQWICVWLILAP